MSDPSDSAAPGASSADALHRLTARLATLDLDPATLEILTAVLTVDLDLSDERQAPLNSTSA